MSVLADFSIFPLDKGESVSAYVARVLKIIKDSGLDYELGPMGTTIEGPFDRVMDVIGACFRELNKDCERIYLNVKMDSRKGRDRGLVGKVRSIESKL